MGTDTFDGMTSNLSAPACHAAAITPSDSTPLATTARAIYVGGAGNVKLDLLGGETAVIFTSVAAGAILPVRATKVYSTDTTATSIVGLW